MQLEVGKKYICRGRPDIKYIEITECTYGSGASYPFVGTTVYTYMGKQEYPVRFTPEGRFWVDVLSKEDLVAEYGADTTAAPKRTIDEVRAFLNDESWIEEAIDELDMEELERKRKDKKDKLKKALSLLREVLET